MEEGLAYFEFKSFGDFVDFCLAASPIWGYCYRLVTTENHEFSPIPLTWLFKPRCRMLEPGGGLLPGDPLEALSIAPWDHPRLPA